MSTGTLSSSMRHTFFHHHQLLLAAVALTGMLATLNAQSGVAPSLVAESERAVVRSQEDLAKAQSLMRRAVEMQESGKLKDSYLLADQSIALAPSGSATVSARAALISTYTSIALTYARELIANGVYSDSIAEQNGIRDEQGLPLSAESVTKSILNPSVNPGNIQAKQLLSDLEQPDQQDHHAEIRGQKGRGCQTAPASLGLCPERSQRTRLEDL